MISIPGNSCVISNEKFKNQPQCNWLLHKLGIGKL